MTIHLISILQQRVETNKNDIVKNIGFIITPQH